MHRLLMAVVVLSFLGILGCSQSVDRDAFRVKQTPTETLPSMSPSQVPPLASHVSSEGEVTPQVAPPNLQQESLPGRTIPSSTVAEANQGFSRPALDGQPMPSATISQPVTGQTQPVIQVDLSAAVALPMTGPEGTMMGFSVDYRLRGTGLPAQSQCVWVIEGQGGKVYRLPVKLDSQGNLMLVVPEWRPEDGPFRCRIQDQMGQPISPTVDMR